MGNVAKNWDSVNKIPPEFTRNDVQDKLILFKSDTCLTRHVYL